jgi:hypothetical protein
MIEESEDCFNPLLPDQEDKPNVQDFSD